MNTTLDASRVSTDLFWRNLAELPYFRALLRSVEARFYQDIELPRPILDIGCGDGHFSSVAFNHPLEVGLDPSKKSLVEAKSKGSYQFLLQAQGGQIPFADESFGSVVSNSVLEHIPNLQPVLLEISRVLESGAPFVFCVPNHNFLPALSIGSILDSLRLGLLGNVYRNFFNRISRHYHCDPPEIWNHRLEKTGFQVDNWWHYFPPRTLRVMEWGHYFGLPSLLIRWVTGRWILLPTQSNLAITHRILRNHFETDPICADGVYTFFVAHKV
ncbi:MAG: class I SAM-dependent methyltransferase [Anaerolineales bacterium]|nr:class I SAM-dependent methyltransferase [Anaerolineales bacterium]